MSKPEQIFMPWGAPEAAPDSDVAAALASVPKAAAHCTTVRAAEALGCCLQTIYNMIDDGTLLARNINADAVSKRKHYRILVRLDRPFDPARKKLLTLEEAARVRSNIDGQNQMAEG